MTEQSVTAGRAEAIRAVPVLHPGRWLGAGFVAVLAAMAVSSLITNPNWNWSLVSEWIFSPPIVKGVGVTLLLTMLIGLLLGVLLAIMRLSTNPILSGVAWVYIWLFRGTPVFVQLFLWGNVIALYATISLGIPFGPELLTFATPGC